MSVDEIAKNYIGAYPLEKMLQYNWYLLNDKTQDGKEALIALLKKMTDEERKQLLASL